jgi:hypothetical protein
MKKWVYRFGDGTAEGCADLRNLLGGKGVGLAEGSASRLRSGGLSPSLGSVEHDQ